MARNQIDLVDIVALVLYPFMGAIALGTVSLSVTVFGGFSFSDVLWSGSGVEVTWASLITVVSIAWIVATNELDGSNYESWEWAVILVAFGMVPLYILVPPIADFVDSTDVVSFILALAQSAAAVWVSYTE